LLSLFGRPFEKSNQGMQQKISVMLEDDFIWVGNVHIFCKKKGRPDLIGPVALDKAQFLTALL